MTQRKRLFTKDNAHKPPRPGSAARMNSTATETKVTRPPAGFPQANRSQVLSQFRTNPFRVLRVRPDVGVDEAIWRSEEALTRLRAGLCLPDGEMIPWMAEPDEPEIRQAVQRIEEPLRRLTDQVFWFDPDNDSDGETLRRVLATLDPNLVNEYLAGCTLEPLPRSSTLENDPIGVFEAATNDASGPNGEAHADGSGRLAIFPEADVAAVPRLLNHANLRLMFAALSLYDALPDGLCMPAPDGKVEKALETINWSWSHGLEVCENPHVLDLTKGRRVLRPRRTADLWNDALAHWLRLLRAPAFLAFVQASIARLQDDVVSADDAEVIVNSVTTRITDLLVGEVKAQLIAGRIDRVRALLEAAETSDIEPRRWALAFRPLRPLFRTEAAELAPLVAADDPRFNDSALYLARLKTLRMRWAALDSKGLLGLDEIGDEAVVAACESLAPLQSYAAVDKLKTLYSAAMGLASADSLKQRIAAAVNRLNGFENYACHFCQSREMDLQRSVVTTGKRESHRSYGFNSTTVHYTIKANIIPRCARCSDLHTYLWNVSSTVHGALGVALVAGVGFMILAKSLGGDTELGVYLILGAIAAILVWPTGILARWAATCFYTPRGERRYWRASTAKQYQEMRSQGCKMTLDYRRNAFQFLRAEQGA
jgi:hypothetical protein